MIRRSGAGDKSGMIRVDVGGLDLNKALRVFRCRTKALPQEFRHNINQLGVQTGKALQFLEKILPKTSG